MNWIGKATGGVLGFFAGGPVGALLGTLIGHQFDRGSAEVRESAQRRDWRWPEGHAVDHRPLFVETTFAAMGYLAKRDGRVSEDEIDAARRVMAHLALSPDEMRRAIEAFGTGKRPGFRPEPQVAVLRAACQGRSDWLRRFLDAQLEFLAARPVIADVERQAVLRMAGALGMDAAGLAHVDGLLRARGARQRVGVPSGPTPAQALHILGVGPDATNDEVKLAYRRLMNRHHPDKQQARGLSSAALALAEEETRRIRAAFEIVRAARGMR